jgi:hypothetical protein
MPESVAHAPDTDTIRAAMPTGSMSEQLQKRLDRERRQRVQTLLVESAFLLAALKDFRERAEEELEQLERPTSRFGRARAALRGDYFDAS